MTTREFDCIADTIAALKEAAAGEMNQRDKENLLHRVDALEWVMSIATIPSSRQPANRG